MMKNRPINIEKLEKMCTSHLTRTKINIVNETYIIEIINTNKFSKTIIINKKIATYKHLINEIMKIKKELKNIKIKD